MDSRASRLKEEVSSASQSAPACFNCGHFIKLSPGRAGLCNLMQHGRKWNEAMAVVSDNHSCDQYAPPLGGGF